ncbi:polysaccharide biosynthesis/export family protein [Parvibaculum sp.]|uniref:polysaccharide biosynthesis/export family protein n=1 Tax=Parvibaculum sp. TaxID=2024848 RepID=UPI001B2CF4DF|nr:polysaccharide biosynthesis/export family protein [Parvibaculum sp.]MBO6668065.1 polysaccharide export protein [Parvibaculum sp.]MBO6692037.1 polysaccharide export protein [Parvibaculum sp.]MBO6715619.1 polysaccharide export protein [Parvibaculum sp.]
MRFSSRTGVFHAFRMMVLLVAAGVLASCADAGRTPPPVPVTAAPATAAPAVAPADANIDTSIDYALGVGDRLRVIVFGEPDLSGEFDVSGSGNVALPLIGQVRAKDLTLSQFEDAVEAKFSEGYLNNPRVSVEVLNYRPFYIYGEVENSGQYPYTNGMTVLNAVAVAGGYTYRANTDRVYITRGDGAEQEYPASQSVKVLPGDVVRVPERFF